MTPLLSLILLVVIAYIGAVFIHKIKTSSAVFKGILNAGIIYLFLGHLIGPKYLKILDFNILQDLSLLVAFALGWTGFLIGLQINAKQMWRFPINYYIKTILILIINFVLITTGLFILKEFIYNNLSLSEILIISIAGAISSPLLIGVLKKDYKMRGRIIHFLQFHSAYDNMVGIVILGIMIFITTELKNDISIIFKNVLIITFGPSVMAIIFYFIAKEIKSISQYFLLIVGFLLIIVGTAMQIGSSIVFIAFLFGMVLANLPINTWKLFQTISNTEKPIFLLLLIFIGARIPQSTYDIIIPLFIFIVLRLVIKYVSSLLVVSNFKELKSYSKIIGLSSFGMGGLSLAIALDYHQLYSYMYGENIVFILAIAYIVNDSFALKLIEKRI